MAKTGVQYGNEVRALRDAGLDFPASRGYLLRSPSQWSSGLKSAVTRRFNQLDIDESGTLEPEEIFEGGIDDDRAQEFFADSAGDREEEFDDVDFFDFDEGEEFIDEENDTYMEDT